MAFPDQSTALGKHAFFFRQGDNITVPAAGSAAGAATRTNKPDATDPLYNDLSVIEDWTWDNKSAGDEKVYAPSPGVMQLYDLIEKSSEFMIKFTTPILQGFMVETFMKSATDIGPAGAVFNPNSGTLKKGWLHVELYDNNNNLGISLDVFGALRVTGGVASKEGSILRPQYEFNVLYSSQNVGLVNNS